MDYTIASNTVAVGSGDAAPVSGTPGDFTDGNPATSVPATTLPAYQMNALVKEIVGIIEGAGLTPDKANNAQLLAAVQAIASGESVFGNTGYQKLPSGLIVQWGTSVSAAASSTAVVFPIEFPTSLLSLNYSQANTTSLGTPAYYYALSVTSVTTAGFNWGAMQINTGTINTSAGTISTRWIAIGY